MNSNPAVAYRFAAERWLLAALLTALAPAVPAATVGEVTHVAGALRVQGESGPARILAPRSAVAEGDLLTTAADTYARVKFVDGGEVTLRPNSQLKVDQYAFQSAEPARDNVVLSLLKGGLRAITGLVGKRKKDAYRMNGIVATIGIRGTAFGAMICQDDCGNVTNESGAMPPNGLHVDVSEGMIVVTNVGGSTLVGAGNFGFVPDAQTGPLIVPPSQGVTANVPQFTGPNSTTPGTEACQIR